jgi:hypothetical protein
MHAPDICFFTAGLSHAGIEEFSISPFLRALPIYRQMGPFQVPYPHANLGISLQTVAPAPNSGVKFLFASREIFVPSAIGQKYCAYTSKITIKSLPEWSRNLTGTC